MLANTADGAELDQALISEAEGVAKKRKSSSLKVLKRSQATHDVKASQEFPIFTIASSDPNQTCLCCLMPFVQIRCTEAVSLFSKVEMPRTEPSPENATV